MASLQPGVTCKMNTIRNQTYKKDFFHDVLRKDLLVFLNSIICKQEKLSKYLIIKPSSLISSFLVEYNIKYHKKDINYNLLFILLLSLEVCPRRDFRRIVKRYKIVKKKVLEKCQFIII